LCLFTARWFGRRAGMVAGLACVSLVVLWELSRSAEIDSMNTLCSVLAACCLIELGYGRNRCAWTWTGAAGFMIGATLLLKGQAGLPLILGALIGPPFALRTMEGLRHPSVWIAGVLGSMMFGLWVLALYVYLQDRSINPDMSGVTEAVRTLHLNEPTKIFQAILVPPLLVLYASPVSFVLPFSFRPPGAIPEHQRRIMMALAATIIVSAVIFLLAGTTNPRYEYVILPLLAPCAGALAMAIEEGHCTSRVRIVFGRVWKWFGVLIAVGHVALVVLVWPYASSQVVLGVSTACIGVLLVTWIRGWRTGCTIAGVMILLLMFVLLGVPFSEWHKHKHFRQSAYAPAQKLRDHIGAGATIATDRLLMSKPEFFFYANVIAEPHSIQDLSGIDPGKWVVLDGSEWDAWGKHLPHVLRDHVCFKVQRHEAHVFRFSDFSTSESVESPVRVSPVACQ